MAVKIFILVLVVMGLLFAKIGRTNLHLSLKVNELQEALLNRVLDRKLPAKENPGD